jgi:hypothetical protein
MTPTDPQKMVHYALFNAHPASEPPFAITLGVGTTKVSLNDCKHIPDGVERILAYTKEFELSPDFVLLYPIYMEAMGTDSESTMHSIAWMIKEQADSRQWKFNRIGGLTGSTERDFQPSDR